MRKYARVTGIGMYAPERVMTNFELEKLMDTSDEWITTRTGIKRRHVAGDDEASSNLATKASLRALEMAGLDPDDLDMIINATVTADKYFPACGCMVQAALGAHKAAAFDVNAGCSGFVYALSIADQFIASGTYKNILCIGVETLTHGFDWQDRNTNVLFGDGAGAAVLQATDECTGPLSFVIGSDGSHGHYLSMSSLFGRPAEWPANGRPRAVFNGPEIFKFAVTTMGKVAKQAVDQAGLSLSDIDLFIPHQANLRIIQAANKYLGMPAEKVFINVQEYGNTSAASIPIALCEAVEQGLVHDGDKILMVAFGAGLSWGATVVQWNPTPSKEPAGANQETYAIAR